MDPANDARGVGTKLGIDATDKGRREFRRMAKVHSDWIAAYFERMPQKDIDRLMELLSTLKDSTRQSIIARQEP